MQFWDTIINTAMIGTDKKQMNSADLPGVMEEAAIQIRQHESKDKEEKFLQLASLMLNYRQCGVLPTQKEIRMAIAPAEEKEYCNAMAVQTLNDILIEDSIPLLKFWLEHCYDKQQIVPPENIPVLLATGIQQKKLQRLIAACCGRRGEWLAEFNPVWNYSSSQTDEELWQSGRLDQRKEVLKQKRKTNPQDAREWVQQTWIQEDANTRAGLLEILEEEINESDIPFLESLATEKSRKVKELAIQLLRQIPGSTILVSYEKVLSQSATFKKEKSMLGMMSKSFLQLKLAEPMDETIYKTGIDPLSNTKELTDEEYVIFQLAQSVPPSFWERHLQMKPEEIIELFQKDGSGKKIFPALVYSITRFRDTRWALYLIRHSRVFYISTLPLLQAQEQELYSNQFFDQYPDDFISYATGRETEWGNELTKNILKHVARNPYRYNRSFFNHHINLIPPTIINDLDRCAPSEENLRNMWINTSEYITRLITLKKQTIKAFNS